MCGIYIYIYIYYIYIYIYNIDFRLPIINSYIANIITPIKVENRFLNNILSDYIISDSELKEIGLFKERNNDIGDAKWIRKGELIEKERPTYDTSETENIGECTVEGSNAWVISGKHTLSGKPILASDPHLENFMPSLWFMVDVTVGGGEYFASGGTMPGIPFFMIGRTNHVAWGVTNMVGENVDLYEEKINQTHVFYDDQWEELTLVNEKIIVRWGADVDFMVMKSRHGPIFHPDNIDRAVSAAFKVYHGIMGDKPISIAWSGFDLNDTAIHGLYLANHAKNAQEVFDACSIVGGLSVNILFATVIIYI